MTLDAYRTLGLPPGAPLAEIKRAYRALAKANHPDSAGDVALPRFLAIQAAYEQLSDPKARAAARSRATARPAEPWRADPARAQEAKAGARRTPGSGAADGSGRTKSGAAAGTRPGSSSKPGAGAGPATGRPTGSRRRTTKKATFGSTTYDEAQDPSDPSWAGASWYGPSTGEYWRVNPREYADPRKHGREYQARAAGGAPDPDAPARGKDPRDRDPAADPPRAGRPGATRSGPGRPASPDPWSSPITDPERRAEPMVPFHIDFARLDTLPMRRAVFALAAWPPLGIAAAALIGEATGCAAFSAACTDAARVYPWVAQALILLGLIVAPPVARVLAGGSAAVAVLSFPVAAALSASGATYDRTYGPAALGGILAIAWLGGVAASLLFRVRRSQRPNPSG